MQVLKFGGSSVADATRMSRVLDIVLDAAARDRVILVSSAISGCTDALIEIGATADPERRTQQIEALRRRHHAIARRLFTGAERERMYTELDALFAELAEAKPEACVSFGELFSTRILAYKAACEGFSTQWLDSRELVRTRNGAVDEEQTYARIRAAVQAAPEVQLFVAPGFIASDENGCVTTLGRGGSDYSAALFAAGAGASVLEIWTDVPGLMTANPKVVPAAVTIPDISYRAALSLAENGAKVLYAPTVGPAMKAGIAFSIRNTFDPRHPGTLVSGRPPVREGAWMGVTSRSVPERGEALVCLVGEAISSRSSAAGRIRSALAEAGIQPLGEVTGEGDCFFIRVRPTVEQAAVERFLAYLPAELRTQYEDALCCSDEEHKIIKAADKLCAYIKCRSELDIGNREFAYAANSTLAQMKEYGCEELDYFMENCLESFGKSLDELKNN